VKPEEKYAELWMGSHPSLSACYHKGGEQIGVELPFLFKLLSVGRALSIQAHPNLQQAVLLHSQEPHHYPDANHKPEMAISLGVFEALSGLAPHQSILDNITM
jgi:mannose-6-phosphate isomerase